MNVPDAEPLDEAAVRRRIERHPVEGSVPAMREAFAALADLPPRENGTTVRRAVLNGLDTLSVTMASARKEAPLPVVHLHGGGYVFGSPDTHERLARVLCSAANGVGAPEIAVHVPAYPLAPEHAWPAQLDAVLDWLSVLDDRQPFALSGDSAGGHLALCLALALSPPLREQLAGIALFSPNTSRDYARSESRRANAARDAMNDPESDDRLACMAFGETDARSPAQNVTRRDLGALPPLHIDVGTAEILLDDSLQLARAAALADVEVELRSEPGAFHLRQLFAQHWSSADTSLERAGRWLGERLCKQA